MSQPENNAPSPSDLQKETSPPTIEAFPHWVQLATSTGQRTEVFGRISYNAHRFPPNLHFDIFAIHRLLHDVGLPILLHLSCKTGSFTKKPSHRSKVVRRSPMLYQIEFNATEIEQGLHSHSSSPQELAQAYDQELKKRLSELLKRYFRDEELPTQINRTGMSFAVSSLTVGLLEAVHSLQASYLFQPQLIAGELRAIFLLSNCLFNVYQFVEFEIDEKEAFKKRDRIPAERNAFIADVTAFEQALFDLRMEPITSSRPIRALAKVPEKLTSLDEKNAREVTADLFFLLPPALAMLLLKSGFPILLSFAARYIDAVKISHLKDQLIQHKPSNE